MTTSSTSFLFFPEIEFATIIVPPIPPIPRAPYSKIFLIDSGDISKCGAIRWNIVFRMFCVFDSDGFKADASTAAKASALCISNDDDEDDEREFAFDDSTAFEDDDGDDELDTGLDLELIATLLIVIAFDDDEETDDDLPICDVGDLKNASDINK